MGSGNSQRQEITDAVMALSRVSTAIGHLIGALDGLEILLKHAENDRDSFKERYIEAKNLLVDVLCTDALNNEMDGHLHREIEAFIGIYHEEEETPDVEG